jgi:hypothetical protein
MKKGNLIHDHSESVAIKGLERNRGYRINYFRGHMLRAFLEMCTYSTLLTGVPLVTRNCCK